MVEFWNDSATDASWQALLRLRKTTDFTLIGGWAVYLWTRALKSKDIDLVADYPALERLMQEFRLKKNPQLRKYEITADGVSVDIYVPFYSNLAIPVEELQKDAVSREGFAVPAPEALVLLKQQAELARASSPKGEKDRVDILSLLLRAPFDGQRYRAVAQRHRLLGYPERLTSIIRTSKAEWRYLGYTDPGKIKREKRRLLALLASR